MALLWSFKSQSTETNNQEKQKQKTVQETTTSISSNKKRLHEYWLKNSIVVFQRSIWHCQTMDEGRSVTRVYAMATYHWAINLYKVTKSFCNECSTICENDTVCHCIHETDKFWTVDKWRININIVLSDILVWDIVQHNCNNHGVQACWSRENVSSATCL